MRSVYVLFFLLCTGAAVENIKQDFIEKILKLAHSKLSIFDDDENLARNAFSIPRLLDSLINVDERVRFYLHTRVSTVNELFINDLDALKNSTFDPKRETKFVTHGWRDSWHSEGCRLITEAFLTLGDYNVILIDWSAVTHRPYSCASFHVKKIGKRVAKMIDFLASNGMDLNTTTLIGHSMGAHVVGIAGYYSKEKVNYVVGLDPSFPFFASKSVGQRISSMDANNVEIIHTCAGKLGLLEPLGKADFYPNGGGQQPGCPFEFLGGCSHTRSIQYFAESLLSKTGFYGRRCKDMQTLLDGECSGEVGIMGGARSYLPYEGIYYVDTNAEAPFAMGTLPSN